MSCKIENGTDAPDPFGTEASELILLSDVKYEKTIEEYWSRFDLEFDSSVMGKNRVRVIQEEGGRIWYQIPADNQVNLIEIGLQMKEWNELIQFAKKSKDNQALNFLSSKWNEVKIRPASNNINELHMIILAVLQIKGVDPQIILNTPDAEGKTRRDDFWEYLIELANAKLGEHDLKLKKINSWKLSDKTNK